MIYTIVKCENKDCLKKLKLSVGEEKGKTFASKFLCPLCGFINNTKEKNKIIKPIVGILSIKSKNNEVSKIKNQIDVNINEGVYYLGYSKAEPLEKNYIQINCSLLDEHHLKLYVQSGEWIISLGNKSEVAYIKDMLKTNTTPIKPLDTFRINSGIKYHLSLITGVVFYLEIIK